MAAITQGLAVTTNLTLTWNSPADAASISGYVVYYGTNSHNYFNRNPAVNTTNYTVTNLIAGTRYFFAVTTLGTNGLESDYSAEVVYPSAVEILSPTTDTRYTNYAGTVVSFGVSAVGLLPLSYQWYKGSNALSDGGNLWGTTTASMVLYDVRKWDEGSYWVAVTNTVSFAVSSNAVLVVVDPTYDTKPPSVAVLPSSGFECETNNAMKVFGTAVDASPGAVTTVLVQVNGTGWQPASMTNPAPDRAAWTNTVTLVAGTNTVDVKAMDSSANVSKIASRKFFLRVPSPLVLVTNGSGSAIVQTPPPYYVGRNYNVQVTPGTGYLLSNVVAQAGGVSSILYTATPKSTAQNGAKIQFPMRTNLTLVANFITNRFIGAAGTYYGLFYDPGAVAHSSAGFIKFNVDSKLAFKGSLWVEGEKVGFLGGFDLAGLGMLNKPVARKGMANEPITIVPQLDLTGAGRITGTVSNGAWSANLSAVLAVYGTSTALPTNVAGQYTMILPGSTNVAAEPGGDGYAVIKVPVVGGIKTSGSFGDGEKVGVIGVPPLKGGWWPFYAPLYKYYRPATNPPTPSGVAATYNGSVMGWLMFTNGNVQNELFWNKTRWTNGIYDGGFTNRVRVLGSRYTPPAVLGQHVLSITNGFVRLQNGNLGSFITNAFSWDDLNRLWFDQDSNLHGIRLSVNVGDGSISGSFAADTNAPTVKTKIYGAVLQNANVARGNFAGTNQSGSIQIQGN